MPARTGEPKGGANRGGNGPERPESPVRRGARNSLPSADIGSIAFRDGPPPETLPPPGGPLRPLPAGPRPFGGPQEPPAGPLGGPPEGSSEEERGSARPAKTRNRFTGGNCLPWRQSSERTIPPAPPPPPGPAPSSRAFHGNHGPAPPIHPVPSGPPAAPRVQASSGWVAESRFFSGVSPPLQRAKQPPSAAVEIGPWQLGLKQENGPCLAPGPARGLPAAPAPSKPTGKQGPGPGRSRGRGFRLKRKFREQARVGPAPSWGNLRWSQAARASRRKNGPSGPGGVLQSQRKTGQAGLFPPGPGAFPHGPPRIPPGSGRGWSPRVPPAGAQPRGARGEAGKRPSVGLSGPIQGPFRPRKGPGNPAGPFPAPGTVPSGPAGPVFQCPLVRKWGGGPRRPGPMGPAPAFLPFWRQTAPTPQFWANRSWRRWESIPRFNCLLFPTTVPGTNPLGIGRGPGRGPEAFPTAWGLFGILATAHRGAREGLGCPL